MGEEGEILSQELEEELERGYVEPQKTRSSKKKKPTKKKASRKSKVVESLPDQDGTSPLETNTVIVGAESISHNINQIRTESVTSKPKCVIIGLNPKRLPGLTKSSGVVKHKGLTLTKESILDACMNQTWTQTPSEFLEPPKQETHGKGITTSSASDYDQGRPKGSGNGGTKIADLTPNGAAFTLTHIGQSFIKKMEDASKLGNEYAKIHEQNLNAVDLLTTACRTVTNMYKDMGDLSQQLIRTQQNMATVEERLFTHEQQIQAQLVQYNTNSYWEKQEAEKEMWKALYYKQQAELAAQNQAQPFIPRPPLMIEDGQVLEDIFPPQDSLPSTPSMGLDTTRSSMSDDDFMKIDTDELINGEMSWQPLQNHIEHEDMKSLTYLFFTNIGVIHCEPVSESKIGYNPTIQRYKTTSSVQLKKGTLLAELELANGQTRYIVDARNCEVCNNSVLTFVVETKHDRTNITTLSPYFKPDTFDKIVSRYFQTEAWYYFSQDNCKNLDGRAAEVREIKEFLKYDQLVKSGKVLNYYVFSRQMYESWVNLAYSSGVDIGSHINVKTLLKMRRGYKLKTENLPQEKRDELSFLQLANHIATQNMTRKNKKKQEKAQREMCKRIVVK